MALFVAPLLIAGCSDNSGPAGPTFPAQQTGSTDGGLTFALSARPGPGDGQFIITLVLTSGAGGAGGRPVPNEPVTFVGGKLNPTRTATDANGTATSVLTCNDPGQVVEVVALFAGVDPADATIEVTCPGTAAAGGGGTTTATGGGGTTLPTVTITATDPTAAENPAAPEGQTGTFTVTSSSPAPAPGLVVSLVVGGGTDPATLVVGATTCPPGPAENQDYVLVSGGVAVSVTVTIPAAATSVTIIVTACDDAAGTALGEPLPPAVQETVVVTLAAGAGYTVGTPSTATVTIISDDP